MSRYEKEEGRPKRCLFTFWRVVTVIALALAGYAILLAPDGEPDGPYVARHYVDGLILNDPKRAVLFRAIAKDDDVEALILRIDSPGGTTAGSEELYDSIRQVAEQKPVVAVMGGLAASGGYIAAIAADHIVARGNTLTGSIGVVAQRPKVTALLDKLGVEVNEVRSGVFKAQPSPFADAPPEVDAWEREIIADSHAWFRGLVSQRRGLTGADLDRVSDGRVFTGRQALERGLIDAVGGPEEATAWLDEQGVDVSLPVRDRKIEDEERPFWMRLLTSTHDLTPALSLNALSTGPRLYSVLD